jgi:multidrug efflux pump subunit AcrB
LCKDKVKDAVDKAKRDLPNDLLDDPQITEFDISEVPIMNVNISGDFSLDKLKDYAEKLKDRIEEMREITRVDMVGALDKEVQINVDKYKMAAAQLTFRDIENAIAFENMTISAGNVDIGGMTRSISIRGDFQGRGADQKHHRSLSVGRPDVFERRGGGETRLRGAGEFQPPERQKRDCPERHQALRRKPDQRLRQNQGDSWPK